MTNETNDATSSLPKDKAELTNRIQREWSALLRAVENLSYEQMTRPGPGGWSTKDNLAHLSEWEQFLLRNQFQGHSPHEALQIDQATLEHSDIDELNAILFERNRDRSLPDILADLHDTHAQLLAALEQMPGSDLMKLTHAIGPEARPVMVWIVYNTYEHYEEHRKTIQAITGEGASS
jgi:uncharacterized protein (TIGR03083 family)